MDTNATMSGPSEARQAERRQRMVEQLAGEIRDRRVLEAMRRVPRHVFVPERLQHAAYENRALPIGEGQTISQPLMVAVMLEAAELQGGERVLDVGAGSGYQSALLAELAAEVYAIELLPELVACARQALARAGTRGVTLVQGDGTRGYPPAAPYDAIVVAAAARHVPQPLVDQLAEGGRLLVPVGGTWGQTLMRLRKHGGEVYREQLGLCAFVPLIDQT